MEKIILKLNTEKELKGCKNDYGFLIFLNEKITLKTTEITEEFKQKISEIDENLLAHCSFYIDEKIIITLKMLNFILNKFNFSQKDKFFKMFYFKTNENKKTDKIYLISYFSNNVNKLEIDTIKQFLQKTQTVEKSVFAKFDNKFYFALKPTQALGNIVYLTIFKNDSKK